jgi:hypothetical protein
MRARPEITKKNILNFLNEIYSLTNERITYLSLNKLCRKHRISNVNCVTIVKSKLLLHFENGYKWNSIKPNLKMADKLLNFNRQTNIKWREDKINIVSDIKKQEVTKPIAKDKKVVVVDNVKKQVATKQQRQVSIFWGMFKFNY